MTAAPSEHAERRPFPPGWRTVRLGDVGAIGAGITLGKLFLREDTRLVPYLRVANVKDGYLDLADVNQLALPEWEIQKCLLRHGDLLLTEGGDPDKLGRGTVWETQLPECIHQNHIFRVRFNPAQIEPKFVAFELQSPYGKAYFLKHAKQTTGIATINQRVLANFPLMLPPLAEQRAIVARIERDMSEVERLGAAGERQRDAISVLQGGVIREAFTSEDRGLWPVTTLGTVLQLRKDVIHPRDRPVGSATFVGLEHLESHTGRRIGSLSVEMTELTGRKPRFYRGDIVYGYLRPYLNKVWVAEFDGLCSVDQYVYSTDPEACDPRYVAAFMRSPLYLERAPITITPGQLPRIRIEEVAAVVMPLPPLAEQHAIVARIERDMGEVERLRAAARRQREAIDALPAALLREVFEGETL